MKDKIISALRVMLAGAIASIMLYLTNQFAFEVSPGFQTMLDSFVSSLSFILGTGAYYLISRIVEKYAPWLLGFSTPAVISNTIDNK